MTIPENFDHYDSALAEDPYPVLRDLREQCPVHWSDRHGGFWALTRYEDIYQVAHDPATFSSNRDHITIPSPEATMPPGSAVPIELDPPEHRIYRSLVSPYFSPQRIATLEPEIRAITSRLIDGFIGRGNADLAQEFAVPLPMFVICKILGIPSDLWPEFRVHIDHLLQLGEDTDQAIAAGLEIARFLTSILEERRQQPEDDLLSFLAHTEIDGHTMPDDKLLGFAVLLFGAGAETTTNAIGNTLSYLAQHSELRERIAGDHALIPAVIEEFLRYDTPVFGLARTATCPTAIGGAEMKDGDRVLLLWGAANHDPAEFDRPDEVDIDRFPNRHIAFGTGIHRCLGSHLARLELRVAFEEIFGRIPDFHLAAGGQVERVVGITRGVRSLPVAFTPNVT